MNKKILMIAYYYPPQGGGGVQRTVKFAKYLPDYGIEPIVLTARLKYQKNPDKSFTSAYKHTVIRIPAPTLHPRLARLIEPLIIPDTQRFWVKKAIKKGLVAAVRHEVRVIYSTSTPYSNHLIGHALARKLKLPWIADFRDLWTANALYRSRAFYQKYFHKKMEARIYREAAHICCASPTQREVIIDRFGIRPDKITTITNGFDPEDFTNLNHKIPATIGTKKEANQKITISYFGSFYGSYRPADFIQAIKIIQNTHEQSLTGVRFLFVGDMDRPTRNLLSDPQLRQQITVKKYVPHGELSNLRKNSDAFFLYLPKISGPIGAMIPQKLFEYLAASKPIFAIVPRSDAANIIRQLKAGHIVKPGEPRVIAQALLQFLNSLTKQKYNNNKAEPDLSSAGLYKYSRPYLTQQLAKIINKIDVHA